MSDIVALHSNGCRWDAGPSHGDVIYEEGPGNICLMPQDAAQHQLHSGGYAPATRDQIQAEIDLLRARIAQLEVFLS
jgi:hypothetical protein